jgi:hypothetical protein
MNPQHYLFIDERFLGVCAYCGGSPDTRDHVPSKFLLDDPLPDQTPAVDACTKCNQGVSLDEEYFGCFLECVMLGSTDPGILRREKVKRALSRNARLAERIRASAANVDGELLWTPERDRVRNVVVKHARGHAAYELSVAQIEEPDDVRYFPLVSLSSEDRVNFESAESGQPRPWPEIGSRAFLRACEAEPFSHQRGPWVSVSPGQYRYLVDQYGGVRVQIVVGEYLGCIVEWR